MPFRREECWVLIGVRRNGLWFGRRRKPSAGTRVEVAFDARWVLRREETRGDVIGFYHTHPPGHLALSERDVRTMRAWVSAFGKALLCVIESGGVSAAYIFETNASSGRALEKVELFPGGYCVGVDTDGGTNPSRSDLPRRGAGRKTGAGARGPVRRRRAGLKPGG